MRVHDCEMHGWHCAFLGMTVKHIAVLPRLVY